MDVWLLIWNLGVVHANHCLGGLSIYDLFLHLVWTRYLPTTSIVYKDWHRTHKIRVEIRNLKVENLNRCLQDFVLHLLNNDIVPVDSDENVPGTQLNRLSPAFHRRVERVLRCTIDGFSRDGHMYKLVCFVYKSADDLL